MLEFKLPEVGENIKSGTVVRIAVKVGDAVKKDQTLLELETDKASLEVPSPANGVIKEILIKENQEVKIGQIVMKIDDGVEAKTPETQALKPASAQPVQTVETPKIETPIQQPTAQNNASIPVQKEIPAAPSVRRFAREIGVEVSKVLGSGPGGRISVEDVKAYTKKLLSSLSSGGTVGSGVESQPLPDFSKWGAIDRQPMNNIRKKTTQHMSYSWTTIPHVTQFDKADITELEKLRKRFSTKERKLTITPFLLKVMAAALKQFPQFNASLDTLSHEIVYKKYFHIGVAVDTERGLLVPIIRNVEKKSIFEIADELNAAAERARNKKTSLDELQGGSMTLTNLGGIGGTMFTPIVNWPEAAILGVSRGGWEQIYNENQFVPRQMLPLSLSYDHRLIDGADGARFLRWVCEALEQPFMMELEG